MSSTELTPYAVIWCDSPRGLISYMCVPPDPKPVVYVHLPDDAVLVESEDELFGILVKRDGTKICIPYAYLYRYLGWSDY